MTFLDLCAGIGGFSLGLEMAGMTCVGQVEIDKYCNKILAKHWPRVPKWWDIKTLDPKELPSADFICGGYPCQPFSHAGKRRGADDDRHLWPFIAAIVAAKRPAWCLFENVAGHVTMGLDGVLSDLEGLGYACRTVVIPACAVNAPHRRDRVWVIANSDYSGGDAPRYCFDRKRQEEEANEKRGGEPQFEFGGRSTSFVNPNSIPRHNKPVAESREYQRERAGALRGCGGADSDPNSKRRQERHIAAVRAGSEQPDGPCRANPVPHAPINILGQHGEPPKIKKTASRHGYIVKRTLGHAAGEPTLKSGLGRGPDGFSPRLDGAWGDGIPKITNHRLPDHAQRLKALGNAVVPPLVREIGLRIMAAHYGEAV